MFHFLIEPFQYNYMIKAITISIVVGGLCSFLSTFLMLKGWSLIGDALSHSVIPGIAGSYILGIPYSIGAFFTGMLAIVFIILIRLMSKLKEDAIIGFVFSTFFAFGLFLISLRPIPVNIQTIIFGNVLGIADSDIIQILIISIFSFITFFFIWKDLLIIFFDENYAYSIGLKILRLKIFFFVLLSACIVTALQTVGAILVISMIITPGAIGYLLSDHFKKILIIAVIIGCLTSGIGAYISFFIDGTTGAVIVSLQTLLFIFTFFLAPKYGFIFNYKKYKKIYINKK
ncbi:MAG: metal ABC transporter permease [Arsenophonus sp.]|nr:MAG: metal ABC transporter permease [Arsenophonus sp.]